MPEALTALLRDLCRARQVLAQRRRGGASKGSLDDARADMVAALSSYTSALSARGLPVPYLLRDELRLYQGISTRG